MGSKRLTSAKEWATRIHVLFRSSVVLTQEQQVREIQNEAYRAGFEDAREMAAFGIEAECPRLDLHGICKKNWCPYCGRAKTIRNLKPNDEETSQHRRIKCVACECGGCKTCGCDCVPDTLGEED